MSRSGHGHAGHPTELFLDREGYSVSEGSFALLLPKATWQIRLLVCIISYCMELHGCPIAGLRSIMLQRIVRRLHCELCAIMPHEVRWLKTSLDCALYYKYAHGKVHGSNLYHPTAYADMANHFVGPLVTLLHRIAFRRTSQERMLSCCMSWHRKENSQHEFCPRMNFYFCATGSGDLWYSSIKTTKPG